MEMEMEMGESPRWPFRVRVSYQRSCLGGYRSEQRRVLFGKELRVDSRTWRSPHCGGRQRGGPAMMDSGLIARQSRVTSCTNMELSKRTGPGREHVVAPATFICKISSMPTPRRTWSLRTAAAAALAVVAWLSGCHSDTGVGSASDGTAAGDHMRGGGATTGGESPGSGAPAGGAQAGGASGSGGAAARGGGDASGGAAAGGGLGPGGSPGGGGLSSSGGMSGSGGVQMVDAAHVRLLSGSPFYDRQQLHRQGYLASLDPDKLLFPYRHLANVPQMNGVTAGYPGWDSGFLVGHMAGHYLSAASRMAAATGDASFATKTNYVVTELAKCQTALNQNGYLAAFPSTVFDWLEGKSTNNGGIVVPYYTVHKIMAGLLDAHHYAGNQQALTVAIAMADYFAARLAALPAATIEKIFRTDGGMNPQNEYGAMSDVLAELATVTGQQKYLDTAKIFNRSWFMTPLAAGQDNLKGLHANCHIAQALGIAHTANLTGDATSA